MTGFRLPEIRRGHDRFLAALDLELKKVEVDIGHHAQHHVKSFSKFKRRSATGSVKDATQFKFIRTSRGRIVRISNNKTRGGYNVSAGLEGGTRPHVIRARNARALRFAVGNNVIFRSSVNHPGTRPYKFLFSATSAAYRFGGPRLANALRRAARKF